MPDDMRIAVGSDHAAEAAKNEMVEYLKSRGFAVTDVTVVVDGRADYPIAGHKVARMVHSGEFSRGLLMCGTGLGMSYVANRYNGVRGALCLDRDYARLSREHNDSNILVMPGRATIYAPHREILETWLDTPFSGVDRHARRVRQIEDPEAE